VRPYIAGRHNYFLYINLMREMHLPLVDHPCKCCFTLDNSYDEMRLHATRCVTIPNAAVSEEGQT
jgi:hypothetical protein